MPYFRGVPPPLFWLEIRPIYSPGRFLGKTPP
jgi:hypothetical protein